MNKLTFIFGCILLVASNYIYSQNRLDVEVISLRSNKGLVYMKLYDENHKLIKPGNGPIINKKCTISFENLKSAKYAVQCFHDENSNHKLDTNFVGIPSEGYGFSNNAYGTFGPKSFDKWLFEIKGDTKISMIIKY